MITVSAFKWVPPFAQGVVRDLRVRWALEEAGLAYQARLIDAEVQASADYRALQPFGQVPVFEEGNLALFESGAIVLHVASRSEALLPADEAGRARAITWVFAALNSIEIQIQQLADTVGDLMMTTVLRILRHTDLLDAEPALKAYKERCEARPAFQRALAAHMEAFQS
ncbi:glutathione S-transferase [Stigmatella sp. ncwal1]|uniref:Glutathione S-transferase n=1 Tax=Stigmatella ashevillensis TaxID=2995309 RepID=A0ABT5DNH9_9BACT|nr:glutathione S-transferase [Stigmatella ashevillena]MDC0715207.1 glutathione S-transferase [Stigmatella ashevillena]